MYCQSIVSKRKAKCSKSGKKVEKKWKFEDQPPEVTDWGSEREGEVWKVEVGMRNKKNGTIDPDTQSKVISVLQRLFAF